VSDVEIELARLRHEMSEDQVAHQQAVSAIQAHHSTTIKALQKQLKEVYSYMLHGSMSRTPLAFDSELQLQEAFTQSVEDCHSLSIEHDRVRLQLRQTIDEERMKSAAAEAALLHWQQRQESTSVMLQAEQQHRQREHQAAVTERQQLANEQFRWENSDAQAKAQLAAALQRCEELTRATESERAAAALQASEINSAHALEVSRIKKSLAEEASRLHDELAKRLDALSCHCRSGMAYSLSVNAWRCPVLYMLQGT
jgi:hypothetical protein